MIETNETGDKQIAELIKHKDSSVFNPWEQSFINDLVRYRKNYTKLAKYQKAVITRLYGWLMGER